MLKKVVYWLGIIVTIIFNLSIVLSLKYKPMKYILIAEEGERKLIDQYLPNSTREVIVTGVGAFNILHALRDLPKDADIINIGYAGSSNFEIGTVVAVSESRLNHCLVKYTEPTYLLPAWGDALSELAPEVRTQLKSAVCYSGTDFVTQSDYRDCAFDMELAFIVGQGFTHVKSLKIISDNLSLHDYREFGSGVEAK